MDDPDNGDTNYNTIGLGAEYLVAADLCLSGYRCSIAAAGMPYDLIVDVGRSLLRVQVKSTQGTKLSNKQKKRGRPRYRNRYQFKSKSGYLDSADVMAFVALDRRVILYKKVFSAATRFEINPNIMTNQHSALSRQHCFGEPQP